MTNASLPKNPGGWKGRLLLSLAEAEERYRHELLDVEERELLRDRIIRLKIRLARASA